MTPNSIYRQINTYPFPLHGCLDTHVGLIRSISPIFRYLIFQLVKERHYSNSNLADREKKRRKFTNRPLYLCSEVHAYHTWRHRRDRRNRDWARALWALEHPWTRTGSRRLPSVCSRSSHRSHSNSGLQWPVRDIGYEMGRGGVMRVHHGGREMICNEEWERRGGSIRGVRGTAIAVVHETRWNEHILSGFAENVRQSSSKIQGRGKKRGVDTADHRVFYGARIRFISLYISP